MPSHDQVGAVGPHGELLDYSRLAATGYPYVGKPPLLPDDQLLKRSRQHYRFGCGLFSSAEPDERIYGRTYGEVMESVCNSVFKLVHKSDPVVNEDLDVQVYLEWIEPYMVDVDTPLPPRVEHSRRRTQPLKEAVEEQPLVQSTSNSERTFRRVPPLKIPPYGKTV